MTKNATEKVLFATDAGWLAQTVEEIIDPDRRIIDPHHHLWDRGARYLIEEVAEDVSSGHNVVATVFSQCDSMYKTSGDPDFAPVGEVEFVNGVAAMAESGLYGPARICAGIVGFADMLLGEKAGDVLDMQMSRAGPRFKGIRNCVVWDSDETIKSTPMDFPEGLLLDPEFRKGVAELDRRGLSFESWLYFSQVPEFADLARAFPSLNMILDHVGGPLGIGQYAGREDEVFRTWKTNMTDLAACPNVTVKLGGLGMHTLGLGLDERSVPAGSEELAELWRPYVDTVIDLFGADRCMFESNFPVDKRSVSYPVLWNAFKRLAGGASEPEKDALFFGTAQRVYNLEAL